MKTPNEIQISGTAYDFSAFMESSRDEFIDKWGEKFVYLVKGEIGRGAGGVSMTPRYNPHPGDNLVYASFLGPNKEGNFRLKKFKITALTLPSGPTKLTVRVIDQSDAEISAVWAWLRERLTSYGFVDDGQTQHAIHKEPASEGKSNGISTPEGIIEFPPPKSKPHVWLDFMDAVNAAGLKFTLDDLAEVSIYSRSHLGKLNPKYKR